MVGSKTEGDRVRHGEEKAVLLDTDTSTSYKIVRRVWRGPQQSRKAAVRRVQLKVNK